MELPVLKPYRKASKKFILDFLGYNANPVPREGEFSDMKNLSSDYFPCISPRGSRQELIDISNNYADERNAILSRNDKLAWVDGDKLYYGTADDNEDVGTVDDTAGLKRSLVAMGGKTLIFPDKKCFHVDPPKTRGEYYGELIDTPTPDLEFKIVLNDVHEFTDSKIFFVKASGTNHTLGDGLRIGDTVTITVSRTGQSDERITAVSDSNVFLYFDSELEEFLYAFFPEVWPATHLSYIKFKEGTFTPEDNLTGVSVTIHRNVPAIDYAITNDNRCWGVKGSDIYASKQGDPFNWNQFQGILTDSYATDVDTNGDFTGAAVYSGNPVFFKEDYIHRVYGNKPSNYQIVTAQAYGVQNGAYKTLVNINNTLFYMSRVGVMAYNGGYPTLISDNFGATKYQGISAGTDGRKYYLSLKDLDSNSYKLFVYDTLKNLWHLEDTMQAICFSYSDGDFYMLNATKGKIELIGAGTEAVEWEATLGEFNEVIDDKKGYSKLSLRVDLDRASELNVLIKYDNSEWITVKSVAGGDKRVIEVPIVPLRCDTFQIKLTGKGFCKVYSLNREFVFGGR
jgi:hypothetical protein